jgi:uncharacterized alkaline shock family protein YloU
MTAQPSSSVSGRPPQDSADASLSEQITQRIAEGDAQPPDPPSVADQVRIAPEVIARIAADAAMSVPGVHALVEPPAAPIGRVLRRMLSPIETAVPGVHVRATNHDVALRMHLEVFSGAIIPAVVQAVRREVVSQVERLTGLSVRAIAIEVCSLHQREPTPARLVESARPSPPHD